MNFSGIFTYDLDLRADLEITVPKYFVDEAALEKSYKQTMWAAAFAAKDFWRSLAGKRLKSSRDEYVKSIDVAFSGETASLRLNGFLPYAVEMGRPGYTMPIKRGQRVPLNVDRHIRFNNPKVWRRGNGQPWSHPGFPGVNLAEEVLEHIDNVIIPSYFGAAFRVY